METIKTYLENMFLSLPDTAEVKKAKMELLSMMEDKYTELKKEGKTENEAVGIVISEFGNLDEIAESLGIPWAVKHGGKEGKEQKEDSDEGFSYGQSAKYKMLSLEQAKEFISIKFKSGLLTAVGVMLCIFAACGPIFFDAIGNFMNSGLRSIMDGIGVTFLFFAIAAAVILFVMSGAVEKGWEWVDKKRFVTDFATKAYVSQLRDEYRYKYAVYMSIGICLCVLSVVPSAILDGFALGNFWDDISGGILLIMIGAGVFFIVLSNIIMDTYDKILKEKNKKGKEAENAEGMPFEDMSFEKEGSDKKRASELYWPTITCIYLCWSFLTFHWHITWIIWPIAALVNAVFNAFVKK